MTTNPTPNPDSDEAIEAQVHAELVEFHRAFLEKNLQPLLPWTTPEQRAEYIQKSQAWCQYDGEDETENNRLAEVADEVLGTMLAAGALSEKDEDALCDKIDEVFNDAVEEVQLHGRMKAMEQMEKIFGPSEPGNIVLGGGGGIRNADGSWTEFEF